MARDRDIGLGLGGFQLRPSLDSPGLSKTPLGQPINQGLSVPSKGS